MEIHKERLQEIVAESIERVLGEECPACSVNSEVNPGLLMEMARINRRENVLFPFAGWEIKIWSNDHTPPHFHIMKDGWNVSFEIGTGNLLGVEKSGANQSVYCYMMNNVQEWLNAPCAVQPKLTNRENAMLLWEQLHDNG